MGQGLTTKQCEAWVYQPVNKHSKSRVSCYIKSLKTPPISTKMINSKQAATLFPLWKIPNSQCRWILWELTDCWTQSFCPGVYVYKLPPVSTELYMCMVWRKYSEWGEAHVDVTKRCEKQLEAGCPMHLLEVCWSLYTVCPVRCLWNDTVGTQSAT